MSVHDDDDDELELVTSVGPLDATVLALREFLHRSGALRATAVVARAPGETPAVIDCGRLEPIEVDLGDRAVYLPHGVALSATMPKLPDVRQLPRFEVDAAQEQLAGPIGGLHHLTDAVEGLARALGGQNVAMVLFETTDPDLPLAITARADTSEPTVVTLGDDEYEIDA